MVLVIDRGLPPLLGVILPQKAPPPPPPKLPDGGVVANKNPAAPPPALLPELSLDGIASGVVDVFDGGQEVGFVFDG